MIAKNVTFGKRFTNFLLDNIVTIIFVVIVILGFFASDGMSISSFLTDVLTRFFRNGLLVVSLVIPVMAGLGLNFGIVIGALAGILSLMFVRYHEMGGLGGLMLAFLIALPLALLFGFLTGRLYNKTRGQEMIASLIVGFFAEGLYLIFCLFIVGGVIPVNPQHTMVIPSLYDKAIGVRTSFDMGLHPSAITNPETQKVGLKYALDYLWRVEFVYALIFLSASMLVYIIVRYILANKNPLIKKTPLWIFLVNCAVFAALLCIGIYSMIVPDSALSKVSPIPGVTGLIILGFCLFTTYFTKTKLGQDCRSVGQSQHIAEISGINVDRTRIIATMISTVLASWGMIIFLQEMGTVSTYTAHKNIGFFSIAALLVGGATASKASVKNAMIGLLLFHAMFIVSPSIGRWFSSSEGVGEYTRSFMVYAVIGISLGLYVWRTLKAEKDKDALE